MDNKRRKVKYIDDDDEMVEERRIPNEMDKLGDMMKTLEVQDNNITEDEVRKFVSQYVKA